MIRVGTSGWQYDDWRGTFYPEDLPKRQWLEVCFDGFHHRGQQHLLPSARASHFRTLA